MKRAVLQLISIFKLEEMLFIYLMNLVFFNVTSREHSLAV